MKTQKAYDMLFGVIVLAIAAFYTVMTCMIPLRDNADVINARTIPFILAALMWILGICQLVFSQKSSKEPLDKGEGVDIKTVIQTALLIILYIALFDMVGFIVMTILYLFFQYIVLTPSDKKINPVLYGIIAVAVSIFVYTVFRYALDIMLPQGIIQFF